jgi:hypothetical protein
VGSLFPRAAKARCKLTHWGSSWITNSSQYSLIAIPRSPPTRASRETTCKPARGILSSVRAPAGLITLQGSEPDYQFDVVKYDGSARIHGLLMALATNTQLPAAGKTSRQPASAQERKLALQLARAKFSEKGLPKRCCCGLKLNPDAHRPRATRTMRRLAPSLSLCPAIREYSTVCSSSPRAPMGT